MPPLVSLRARAELDEVPLELQLLVANEVDELADRRRTALCLALPRLGLAALQRAGALRGDSHVGGVVAGSA